MAGPRPRGRPRQQVTLRHPAGAGTCPRPTQLRPAHGALQGTSPSSTPTCDGNHLVSVAEEVGLSRRPAAPRVRGAEAAPRACAQTCLGTRGTHGPRSLLTCPCSELGDKQCWPRPLS